MASFETAPAGTGPDGSPITLPNANLLEKYGFLSFYPDARSDYIPPDYYDKLLKPYTFDGIEDLGMLHSNINQLNNSSTPLTICELGGGTGRATKAALDAFAEKGHAVGSYLVNDLSPEMIGSLSSQFADIPGFTAYEADHLDALEQLADKTPNGIDHLFSLWSFSHSIHQWIEKDGEARTEKRVTDAMTEIVGSQLNKDGQLYILHFDTNSPEQRILVRQYEKFFPEFQNLNEQSRSKEMLDRVFGSIADNMANVQLRIPHHKGDAIHYKDLREGMEVFMNFHMEGELNRHPQLEQIVAEVESDLSQYQQSDGSLAVEPGCFTYELKKS